MCHFATYYLQNVLILKVFWKSKPFILKNDLKIYFLRSKGINHSNVTVVNVFWIMINILRTQKALANID